MISAQHALILSILVPLVATIAIRLLDQKPNFRETATITASIITFLLVLLVYQSVASGLTPELTLIEPFPGVSITLQAEPIGTLFALMASFLWIVTSIYSIGYMRGHHEKTRLASIYFLQSRLQALWALHSLPTVLRYSCFTKH